MAETRKKRFDQLLQVMVTQPVPSEKLAKEARTSKQAGGASYGDTRTRAGKAGCGRTVMKDLEKCLLTLLRRYNAADYYNKPVIAFYIVKLAAARSRILK
jgi:hypothetical protein